MGRKTIHFKGFSVVSGNMKADVSLDRFSAQFNDAQFWLDSQIMTDMVPYMPMQSGDFIQRTRAMSASMAGTGSVVAAAPPMGRFLYEGKKMVNAATGKGPQKIPTGPGEYVWRWPKGAKLSATNQPLELSKNAHPKATDHWFDAAEKAHGKAWISGVKKRAGGG